MLDSFRKLKQPSILMHDPLRVKQGQLAPNLNLFILGSQVKHEPGPYALHVRQE
jgi:hypothetical protein